MGHLVEIKPQPVSRIRTTEQLTAAIGTLLHENAAFLIAPEVEDEHTGETISGNERITRIVSVLHSLAGLWDMLHHPRRTVLPEGDLGMHGNIYEADMLYSNYLHYHHTPQGTLTATFAQARKGYVAESTKAKPILTDALRQGRTDVRYADPSSFMRTDVIPGEVILFRLHKGERGFPYLHDFLTTSPTREVEITALYDCGSLNDR